MKYSDLDYLIKNKSENYHKIPPATSQSSLGKLINADVQGGYNIIKKAIPKAFMNLQVIRADGI